MRDLAALRRVTVGEERALCIWGSSNLYPQLLAAGILDRLMVRTYPVVFGLGKRLSGNRTPAGAMKLLKGEVIESGVIVATHGPCGDVPTGCRATNKVSFRVNLEETRWWDCDGRRA